MGILPMLLGNRKITQWINHRNLYLLGLATILAGVSWSNLLMSLGQFILLGNFILELDFKKKLSKLFTRPYFWILISIYFAFLIGLFWTADFEYAFKDLRIKLPLLLLPLVIGSSPQLEPKEWKFLFQIYIGSLLLLTLASFYKLISFHEHLFYEKRNLSIYISHIRYGLNLAYGAAVLFIGRPLFINRKNSLLLSVYLIICLFSFELYTGILAFLIFILIYFSIIPFSKNQKPIHKIAGISFTLLLIILAVIFVKDSFQDYKKPEPTNYNQNNITYKTANGNYYWTNMKDPREVNGVYLIRFISLQELRHEWPKLSKKELSEKDGNGQPLETTLIHYMTSKGLSKDSVGIHLLSQEDIKAIESGVANYRYLNLNPIEKRLQQTFYEIEIYRQTGYTSGLSLVLRLNYWETAWKIIKKDPWKGVGTGDVKVAFQQQYKIGNSTIAPKYQKRTHNQYLTLWLTLGIGGLLLFIFLLVAVLFKNKGELKLYFIAFWLISFLSFFTEDTLETQAGVTFFAIFNTLFVLASTSHKNQTSL